VFESGTRKERDLLIRFVESPDESAELSRRERGAIIIAGSGMCEAGRIKFHLRSNLPRQESSVVIIGFQAQGTLGRRLVDGAETVRIFGDEIPVRAKVHTIGGLSAHADQSGLLEWMKALPSPPRETFIVHGEYATALTFSEVIHKQLGWRVNVPDRGTVVTL
jgi:metallo-beta-lactamase family protein